MEQKRLRPQVKRLMKDRGYVVYRYQEEAVQQALTVLEEYGGVILADVVGLGKSVIASWLARERNGRGLVICPPALMGDAKTRDSGWYQYLSDFGLHDWDVYSLGALDKVQDYLATYGEDVTTIVVDEAHRFRNEDTEAYERLSQICANRAVILLTATPFNNAPSDIFALLKLFIPPGKSTLTLDEKLAARFSRYNSEFRKLSYILRYHAAGGEKQKRAEKYYADVFEAPLPIDKQRVQRRARALANEIRAVIEPVVIRRNRLDLKRDPVYREEITALSDVSDPVELFYELTPEQSSFYDRVINDYFGEDSGFRGAIYQPFAYEQRHRGEQLEEEFTYQQQRNLYEFMRRLLVKRFESSFGAFAQSIQNFIRVHEQVLAFIENSGGRYILDRRLLEKIYAADPEEIDAALKDFIRVLAEKEKPDPRHDRIYDIDKFDDPEGFLRDIQSDLDLLKEIADRVQALDMVANDPKAARLVQALQDILTTPPHPGEPQRKVVIFSEYRDTVQHIAPILQGAFPGRVLVTPGNLSKKFFSDLLGNFDASHPADKQGDDYDILLTTDKLSEGVNLNRAGAVINYDIPWNPTRVIQRLGRINRIGRKVFAGLYIYNFFPTQQGADVVKSREIAAQKMFLIHNTLGEDAKIFAPDETPTPAELFKRINRNPEDEEEESLLTTIRKAFFTIQKQHPALAAHLGDFPARVKTAKASEQNELFVFRRKGLQLFIHSVPDTGAEPPTIRTMTLEDALPHIQCPAETPRISLSPRFWPAYEEIKRYREHTPMPHSEQSVIVKAENNLRSAREKHAAALDAYLPFIQTLLRDIKEFQTLPKYTLRRLAAVEMDAKASPERLERFKSVLDELRRTLGDDYLERIEQRVKSFRSEIIIAIENIKE
ncbi:MAG: helicase [Calditrichaeota bacterium]|nr:MAG: helicase [Calditrichota bacterium]